MVNYGDLQFAKRIMVARRSEMSAEWKVRFAICIAYVAIQAFTKLLFSFSDVLKTINCTFQEVEVANLTFQSSEIFTLLFRGLLFGTFVYVYSECTVNVCSSCR